MPRIGDQLGPYQLIRKIGQGSCGVVWLAERRTELSTTKVALKLPLDDDVDLKTIRQEAELWSQASGHANILPIIEANIYDHQAVIVSEYAPDGSLIDWMKNRPTIQLDAALDMMLGILSGLEFLHSRHIIHRDLKPANILLQGETPRLADFGISRVYKSTSQSSIVAGTPIYMAPESFDGKRSVQSDIWSAGVIFYQLLSGRLPFPQTDMTALVGAILTRSPNPLPSNIPPAFQAIVARALEKAPEKRFQSVAEMRMGLKKAMQAGGASTIDDEITRVRPRPAPSPVPPKKRSYAGWIVAIVGILFVGVLAIAGVVWFAAREYAIRQETQAKIELERKAREEAEKKGIVADQKRLEAEQRASQERASREALQKLQAQKNEPPKIDPTPAVSSTQTFQGRVYEYAVEMTLQRHGNEITGNYFYTKFKKNIQARGRLDQNGKLILYGYYQGSLIDIFEGRVISDNEINGVWYKPGHENKKLPFNLKAAM